MRKRFWGSMIICLFVTFSSPTFVAVSKVDCKNQVVCAEARVWGGNKLRAKARVSSPRSYDGRWTYRLQLGNDSPIANQNTYFKGYSKTWMIDKLTGTGSAYASNHARSRFSGTTLYAQMSDSHPKDDD